MDNQYIVAFKAGSSGRFVANLLWGLLTPIHYEYSLSDYNSTHTFSPYATSFEIVKRGDRPFNKPDIYDNLYFKSSPGVATLHVYPDFDVINYRFPDVRTIIISLSKSDIPEVAGNSLLKNGFEKLKLSDYKPGLDHCTSFIYNEYLSEFKEPYMGQEIPLGFKKELFARYQKGFAIDTLMSGFLSPVVPDTNSETTLIINYNELCNSQETVLEKLSWFTSKEVNNRVVGLYQQYLAGREKLIKEQMPWMI